MFLTVHKNCKVACMSLCKKYLFNKTQPSGEEISTHQLFNEYSMTSTLKYSDYNIILNTVCGKFYEKHYESNYTF